MYKYSERGIVMYYIIGMLILNCLVIIAIVDQGIDLYRALKEGICNEE